MTVFRWSIDQLNPALRKQAREKIAAINGTVRTHSNDERETLEIPEPKPNKYNAKRCEVDGQVFDSLKEANKWRELRLLEAAGEIRDLERQVRFKLDVSGVHICDYIADFVFARRTGPVVMDVKSEPTRKRRDYRLKAKLMQAVHGVRIEEA
jgi:hypothetical protein